MSNTEIKRYECLVPDPANNPMTPYSEGKYVLFSDIEPVLKENEELRRKCRNLDEVIGSLDVRDPNACDALLNVQLQNQRTIEELKKKLDKARESLKEISKKATGEELRKRLYFCINVAEETLGELK